MTHEGVRGELNLLHLFWALQRIHRHTLKPEYGLASPSLSFTGVAIG